MPDLPQTMHACVLHEHGGPDALRYHDDWPLPKVGPDDLLIRNKALPELALELLEGGERRIELALGLEQAPFGERERRSLGGRGRPSTVTQASPASMAPSMAKPR